MVRRIEIIVGMAALLAASPVSAHEAHVDGIFRHWTSDPWVTIPIGLSALLYASGFARLSHKSGIGTGRRRWQTACFVAGWLTLVLALISPIHWLGERLFSIHMVEHELVVAVAAPLLAMARPIATLLWALPRSGRHLIGALARNRWVTTTWRHCSDPITATTLHGITIWIWHAPMLFDAAVVHPALHRLQHVSFIVTALLFWWALLRRPTHERGVAALHTAATMIHTGLLGVLLTLSPQLLYRAQVEQVWGLSPLEDQQLAGLIMWIPAGLIYAGATLAFAGLWVAHASGGATKVHDHALRAD